MTTTDDILKEMDVMTKGGLGEKKNPSAKDLMDQQELGSKIRIFNLKNKNHEVTQFPSNRKKS